MEAQAKKNLAVKADEQRCFLTQTQHEIEFLTESFLCFLSNWSYKAHANVQGIDTRERVRHKCTGGYQNLVLEPF